MLPTNQLTMKMEITIRKAEPADLDRLMEIFEQARRFMAASGNPNQWVNGYPQRELIEREIRLAHCYACCTSQGRVVATFCFLPSPDPFYDRIDDGQWLNDAPYYVIHRLASDGTVKGIGKICIDWCGAQCGNLRIDTHADNRVMQRLAERCGFQRCGIVYVANGTPRIAYQRTLFTDPSSAES